MASAAPESHISYTGLGSRCSQTSITMFQFYCRWRCCQEDEKNVTRPLFPRRAGEGRLARPSLWQSPVNHGATAEIQCGNSLVWKVLFLGWKQMPAAPPRRCVHSLPGSSGPHLPCSSPLSMHGAAQPSLQRLSCTFPKPLPPCTGSPCQGWEGSGRNRNKNMLGKSLLATAF